MEAEVPERDQRPAASFPIISCRGDLEALAEKLSALIGARRALLCTTPTVARLFGEALERVVSSRPDGIKLEVFNFSETDKSIHAVGEVAAAAKAFGIGRRDVLVAIGGGVCSDVVRVAAGLIRRGVPHICVPTTLIGQIDAGIGIKGAINFEGSKSYLGLFYPPEAALIWPPFLVTLPINAWRDGLAEALKLACIADGGLFESVAAVTRSLQRRPPTFAADAIYDTVRVSIEITAAELALDPREQGTLERMLDFGHTFSPLIETRSKHAISHGHAVAIDICFSTLIAKHLDLIDAVSALAIVEQIANAGLPTDCAELDRELVIGAIKAAEQHRGGKLNLVVPIKMGRCGFIRDAAVLSEALIAAALAELKAWSLPAGAGVDHEISRGVAYAEPSTLMSITTRRTL